MNWNEVTVYTKKEAIEALSGAIMNLGISSFVVEEPDEILAFIEENSDKWDMLDEELDNTIHNIRPNIKLYVADDEDGSSLMGALEDMVNSLKNSGNEMFSDLETETVNVKDEDWQYNWREFFKPFTLGGKLYIKPVWIDNDFEGRITVEIDPGSSFGSGQHETTKMALEALEKYVSDDILVADIGSGSGILSVAAAKLGARKVIAIDIDENAVVATKECAQTNHVEDKVEAICADLADALCEKPDVVVANIFAGPICTLAAQLKDLLDKGSFFISTGIIESRADEVKQAYLDNGYEIIEVRNMGQWYLIVGQK